MDLVQDTCLSQKEWIPLVYDLVLTNLLVLPYELSSSEL